MRRKFIIAIVWLLGSGLLILPYFVGKAANETFLHLYPISWPFLYSIGFVVCGCLVVSNLLLLALFPISSDIADYFEKRSNKKQI